jgi:hypothetical protein
MPVVESVRIRQYILTEGQLESISVQYTVDGRSARVKFSGIEPLKATLEAWRASVRERRGMYLRVHAGVAGTAGGE